MRIFDEIDKAWDRASKRVRAEIKQLNDESDKAIKILDDEIENDTDIPKHKSQGQ